MPVVVEGTDHLRELAHRLKQTDRPIRAQLVKHLRTVTKPVTEDVKQTVRSAPSHGRRGLAHRRRAAKTLARARPISELRARELALKRGTTTEAEQARSRARQAAKAAAGAGLRDSIANATTAAVSTSAKSGVNATWRVRASKMANSQRKLPKYFNRDKGWRHPLFGDKQHWYAQRGVPYFDAVINHHRDDLEKAVIEAMQVVADELTGKADTP